MTTEEELQRDGQVYIEAFNELKRATDEAEEAKTRCESLQIRMLNAREPLCKSVGRNISRRLIRCGDDSILIEFHNGKTVQDDYATVTVFNFDGEVGPS